MYVNESTALPNIKNIMFPSIHNQHITKTTLRFVVSFLISVVWICLYSYVMVWMITVIGFTLGIPDTVMGLTFIAAGVR